MDATQRLSWLDDDTLAHFATDGVSDPSLWQARYDPGCPSEFYRGYATMLSYVAAVLRMNAHSLVNQIDALNATIQQLPADERRNGANFALMNVATYTQSGTLPQIAQTVDAELVCIARCFLQNQSRGL